MDDDERIGALFAQAVGTLEPPTERLITGGIARARRRGRLLRGAEALTGVAVLAGVAALVVALVPDGGGRGAQAVAPPSGQATSAASGVPTPASVPITPQALLQDALRTIPRPGTTTRYSGSSSPGEVDAQFVYDDGQGEAQIDLSLSYGPDSGGLGAACQISQCITRPDSTINAVYQGNGHPGDPSIPGKEWEVSALRPDGVTVSITEFNSAREKGAPQTRTDPPFTIDELTRWTGSGWQVQISADAARSAATLFTPGTSGLPHH